MDIILETTQSAEIIFPIAQGVPGPKGDTGPQGSGVKITPWTAGAYLLGDQVNYLGKDWVANAATLSTDVPGVSTKWVDRLFGYPYFPFVTKSQSQRLDNLQTIFPQDFYDKTAINLGITSSKLTSYAGFLGQVFKLTTTANGTYHRMFEMVGFKPNNTKNLYIEIDYLVTSGNWKINAFSTPGITYSHNQFSLLTNGRVERVRFEITSAQLINFTGTQTFADYFSCDNTIGAEMYYGNVKIWQGTETTPIFGEEHVRTSIVKQINEGSYDPTPLKISYPLVTKSSAQSIDGNQVGFPSDLVNSAFKNVGISSVWLPTLNGFIGNVIKINSVTNSNYCRFLENLNIVPDLNKPLFLEFDYKVISGNWFLAAYATKISSTAISAYRPNTTLISDGLIRRLRIETTTAQLSALTGYTISDYFFNNNGATVASEMYVGNFKLWQGNEYIDVSGEDEVKQNIAKKINEGTYLPVSLINMPATNLRTSFVGSSVTWGDGFLQSGLVKETILNMQKRKSNVILCNDSSIVPINAGSQTLLNSVNDRKFFNGNALKITGTNAEISFTLEGDEVSIIQGIERSNLNASEIEIYVNGVLYDTFNNWNTSAIGSTTKNFTGNGIDTKFDLGRAFTFGHTVTVNGVTKVGTLYQGGYGGAIPTSDDFMIIRKYGTDVYGNPEVHHWIYFKVAPVNGSAIVSNFNYGEELSYEKTTIGKTNAGILESAYGDGDVSFDLSNPASLSSGLDYRETDKRVIKTYRFASKATRVIKLKIKGNYNGASGTPYFIFNFATNRLFHFQNAGIGGWQLNTFNDVTEFNRSYKKVSEFEPDNILIETTPNDDWYVKGHKLSTVYNGLTLAQLQGFRTLPAKSITYNSGSNTYDFNKWVGKIQAIDERSVTVLVDATHVVDSLPIVGDYVFIGQYFSNNKEYVTRRISAYDNTTKKISFDKPINKSDFIYDDLQNLVGLEVRVRDYSLFDTKLRLSITNLRNAHPSAKIGVVGNPLPAIQVRELWGYWEVIGKVADEMSAENLRVSSFYNYQYSQAKNSSVVTIDATTLVTDAFTGFKEIDLSTLTAGSNYINFEVLVNGIDVYGKDAFIHNGLAMGVDTAKTGIALNMTSTANNTSGNQVANKKPRLVFIKNAPTSGNILIKYSNNKWSGDSCHVYNDEDGSKLYGELYYDFLNK